ncbi:MAG: hypothetical protein R2698_02080 [Microthrixaceae bacterium]
MPDGVKLVETARWWIGRITGAPRVVARACSRAYNSSIAAWAGYTPGKKVNTVVLTLAILGALTLVLSSGGSSSTEIVMARPISEPSASTVVTTTTGAVAPETSEAGVLSESFERVTVPVDPPAPVTSPNPWAGLVVEAGRADPTTTSVPAARAVAVTPASWERLRLALGFFSALTAPVPVVPVAAVPVAVSAPKPPPTTPAPTQPTITRPTDPAPTTSPTTDPPRTTVPPTTRPPRTTVAPTTVPPTTASPSTAPPTTAPPRTTAPPTTAPPTTDPPTTEPPTTAAPPGDPLQRLLDLLDGD